MLLVQPINNKELKHLPKLAFELFNPNTLIESKKFPNVTKITINRKYPQFKPLFDNKELYERILPKAVDSGLIKKIPRKKGWKKEYYYFLNPDLLFKISDNGIEITEDSKVIFRRFKHHVLNYPTGKETIFEENINVHKDDDVPINLNDYITSNLTSIIQIFNLFWWVIKHPSLISETIRVYREYLYHPKKAVHRKRLEWIKKSDLPSTWFNNRYLWEKAKKQDVFHTLGGKRVELGPLFDILPNSELSIYFNPTYKIFNCFSNIEDHLTEIFSRDALFDKKMTIMQILELLTSNDYEIISEKRSIVFTSFLMFENPILNNIHNIEYFSDEEYKDIKKFKDSICRVRSARNTQLVENIIFHSKGPMFSFLKTNVDIEKAFENQRLQYIIPQGYG